MTPAKLRLAMAAMGKPETNVGAQCRELWVLPGLPSIDMSRLLENPVQCSTAALLDPATYSEELILLLDSAQGALDVQTERVVRRSRGSIRSKTSVL
jgi:hypothetical protein